MRTVACAALGGLCFIASPLWFLLSWLLGGSGACLFLGVMLQLIGATSFLGVVYNYSSVRRSTVQDLVRDEVFRQTHPTTRNLRSVHSGD